EILAAEVLCGGEWLSREVDSVCGADLMSDVLAFTHENTLLLTGLTNIQVIRTAEMSDLIGIVFVRGKRPGGEVLKLAYLNQLPLLATELPLYEACGRLYQAGCGQGRGQKGGQRRCLTDKQFV
ncbi:MAG: DRTGG domain-containing protein, partial [Sporomusaceae bacterium]|nr:DRTGG domain-containing protein [Sporomusaceae bacterium]